MKEEMKKDKDAELGDVITTWVGRAQSGGCSAEEAVAEIRKRLPPRVLEYLLPRMVLEGGEALRRGVIDLHKKLLGKRARPFLEKMLADERAGLAEKRWAVHEFKALGEIIDTRLSQDLDTAEAVRERLLAGIRDPGSLAQNDMALLRDTLMGLYPALRMSLVREIIHQHAENGAPFLAFCFGTDARWDEELVDSLGREPNEWTRDMLIRWLSQTKDRSLVKRIKKILHKMRTMGIVVPAMEASIKGPPVWAPAVPPGPEGFVSSIDPHGMRIVWLMRHRQPKGYYFFSALVHEQMGLIDFEPVELSSKQAQAYKEKVQKREDVWVVRADPAYCAFLIHEAYQRTPTQEGRAMESYTAVRGLVEQMRPKEAPTPLIYTAGDAVESADDPLGETRRLLDHELLAGWRVEEPRVKSFSSALQDIQESKIIVHPLQKKERIESFYIQTARELFSEEGCRMLWRRRLEETAWVFHKRGYEGEARLAVRVARLLATPNEDPSRSAFIAELVRRSIAESLEQKKKAEATQPSLIVKP